MIDLAEIKAALAKTTPGLWVDICPDRYGEHVLHQIENLHGDNWTYPRVTGDDQAFITAAHNVYVPWLIAEVERLRKKESTGWPGGGVIGY